jgi:hypothetical protein
MRSIPDDYIPKMESVSKNGEQFQDRRFAWSKEPDSFPAKRPVYPENGVAYWFGNAVLLGSDPSHASLVRYSRKTSHGPEGPRGNSWITRSVV